MHRAPSRPPNPLRRPLLSLRASLLALACGALLTATDVQATRPAADSLTSRTLMHRALDLERAAGFDVPERLYRTLDDALARAERALPRRTSEGYGDLSRRQAAKLLKKVNRALGGLCPTGDKAPDGLISTALRTGVCDCDIYVVFYLSLAERTGLPLKAVLAPRHMMLEWQGDAGAFYWETTSAAARDEAFYLDWLQPAATSVEAGHYLRPLSEREMDGYLLFLRGTRLHDIGRTEAARRDLERALELYPALLNARHVLAATYAEQGNHAHAIELFTQVLRADPHFARALYRRAGSHYLAGHYAQAQADYDRYIELEGPTADALLGRAQALQAQGSYDAALKAYGRSLKLEDRAAARLSRGTLHLLMKAYRRAAKDFTKALKLSAAHHQAYLLRAHAYELDGRPDRALADVRLFIQQAQEEGPFAHLMPSAHELLAKLREEDEVAALGG